MKVKTGALPIMLTLRDESLPEEYNSLPKRMAKVEAECGSEVTSVFQLTIELTSVRRKRKEKILSTKPHERNTNIRVLCFVLFCVSSWISSFPPTSVELAFD